MYFVVFRCLITCSYSYLICSIFSGRRYWTYLPLFGVISPLSLCSCLLIPLWYAVLWISYFFVMTVVLLHLNRCICVAFLYPCLVLLWTSNIHKHIFGGIGGREYAGNIYVHMEDEQRISVPSQWGPSIPDCGNFVLTTNLQCCVFFYLIPWDHLSLCLM